MVDENEALFQALGQHQRDIGRQETAIADVDAKQSEIIESIQSLRDTSDATPQVITVSPDTGSERVVMMTATGLSFGLALAALITTLLLRRVDPGRPPVERLEPSTEF